MDPSADLLPPLAAFAVGALLGPAWIRAQRARGLTSRDIYKGVEGVPRAGGLIALAGLAVGYALALGEPGAAEALFATVAIGLVGLLDDLRGLSEHVRVLAPLLVALALGRAADPVLLLPFSGLFYGATGWLGLLAVPVMSNAFNMLDPVNGFLPAANVAVALSMAAVAALLGREGAVPLFLIHAAASAALYLYNRYPARTFNGNVGSYALGASISAAAVVHGLAAYMVLAALPFVVNGALIIFSAGGIRGRERIERPTALEGGLVRQQCGSPIVSLVRVLVADGPLGEYAIFRRLLALVAVTSALTVAVAALQRP